MPRLSPKAQEGKKFLAELQGKKRCKQGKPCGSACVSPLKSCKVSLPGNLEKSLNKVSEEVEQAKRARCEENWAELIVAAVLENPESNSIEDILNSGVAKNEPAYVKDLLKRKPDRVTRYIEDFKTEIKKAGINPENVEKVYLLGKHQDKHPEIKKLQESLNTKEKKGDVIVKMKSGEFIGFSVKDSSGATLTNYSVEKLLPNLSESLKQSRLKMVRDAGLPETFDKALRPKYNDLFRGGRNSYHNQLRDAIMANKDEMLNQWTNGLFAKTPFPLYSFDGKKLRANDSSSVNSSKFDLRAIENPNPNARGASKIFFLVTENGKPSYIWDIRWKGKTGFGSPQIQTIRFNPEKGKVIAPFQP